VSQKSSVHSKGTRKQKKKKGKREKRVTGQAQRGGGDKIKTKTQNDCRVLVPIA
jgi:hypothetical protein